MQFIINDTLIETLMHSPLSLANVLIESYACSSTSSSSSSSSSEYEPADIVLDIAQLTLQTNGPVILSKLSEFLRHLLLKQVPVTKIIVEDDWLKNPLIIKANALLNKLFPEANISIYGISGHALNLAEIAPSYTQSMMMPSSSSSDAPYSFYPQINMTVYQEHIATRITEPFSLNQGQLDACGVTSYLMQVLETQPELYKKLALELVDKGQSESVVSLRAPESSKLTKNGEFRSSSSAVILNAFQNSLSFLNQIGIPVEIVGWLEGVVNTITPDEMTTRFNTFKMYVLDDLSAKLANLPRQIVEYLTRSGYEVTKETAKMLPMEFFKNIISEQPHNPDKASILKDIQRLTYSDIHSETTMLTLKNELQEIEQKLQNGHQAILLLESSWNWKITGLEGSLPAGFSHYNYCKDFHLYKAGSRDKVRFTLYTWGQKFDIETSLSTFSKHYCGVILSKPNGLSTSMQDDEPSHNNTLLTSYSDKKARRTSSRKAKRLEREPYINQHVHDVRDVSPKRAAKKARRHKP